MKKAAKEKKTAKKRGPGWPRVLLAVCVVFALALSAAIYFIDEHAGRIIEDGLKNHLPKISKGLNLNIEFSDLEFGIIPGVHINDVRIRSTDSDTSLPFINIPKVSVRPSICSEPNLHICIGGISLRGPSFLIYFGSDGVTNLPGWIVSHFKTKPQGDDDSDVVLPENSLPLSSLGRIFRMPSVFDVEWDGAELEVIDEGNFEGEKGVAFKVKNFSGGVNWDPRRGRVSLLTYGNWNGGDGRVGIEMESEGGVLDIAVSGKGIELSSLSPYLGDLLGGGSGTVDANVNFISKPDLHPKIVKFDVKLKNAIFNHWRISDIPIRGANASTDGELELDYDHWHIDVKSMRVGMNDVSLDVNGSVDYAESPHFVGSITADDMPLQRIVDAIPADFIPKVKGALVEGKLDLKIDFDLDLAKLSAFEFEPEVAVEDFRIVKYPKDVNLEKLKGVFKHSVKRDGRTIKEFVVGPSNFYFIPFKRLGDYAKKGVMTCEDGRFFAHNGFQLRHIRESVIQNIREKRFARGASTITMQSAKNLFLSGKKNLSRKFQEMLIAYAMEQVLGKNRILEIYMNIIEWGPDVYGVGRASKYYFDKWPKDLAPLEGAFLGSIIHNPVKYHYMYKQGYIPDQWATYLSLILSKMNIDYEEYKDAAPYEPEFDWVRREREAKEKMEEGVAEAEDVPKEEQGVKIKRTHKYDRDASD